MASHLTLIYGLRWDRFQAPAGEANAPFAYTQHFTTPSRNWAPRLGLAWQLGPKTVLRASSGFFYEAPPTNLWYNSFINDGSTRAFTDTFSPTTPNAPAFPNVFKFLPGATLPAIPSIFAVTPGFKNAYTINTNVQIEQQLAQNDKIIAGYVHTGARDLGFERNMNLINPTGYAAGWPADLLLGDQCEHTALSAIQRHHATGRRRHFQLRRHGGELHAPLLEGIRAERELYLVALHQRRSGCKQLRAERRD